MAVKHESYGFQILHSNHYDVKIHNCPILGLYCEKLNVQIIVSLLISFSQNNILIVLMRLMSTNCSGIQRENLTLSSQLPNCKECVRFAFLFSDMLV